MTRTVIIVAAMTVGGVIGRNGKLPWHIPEELEEFRRITTGGTVVMGRKTWESLPQSVRPLPDRKNVVVTNDRNYQAPGAIVVHSLEEACAVSERVFVIGGASLYEQALSVADYLFMSVIFHPYEGDTHFPEFSARDWAYKGYRRDRTDYVSLVYERVAHG